MNHGKGNKTTSLSQDGILFTQNTSPPMINTILQGNQGIFDYKSYIISDLVWSHFISWSTYIYRLPQCPHITISLTNNMKHQLSKYHFTIGTTHLCNVFQSPRMTAVYEWVLSAAQAIFVQAHVRRTRYILAYSHSITWIVHYRGYGYGSAPYSYDWSLVSTLAWYAYYYTCATSHKSFVILIIMIIRIKFMDITMNLNKACIIINSNKSIICNNNEFK